MKELALQMKLMKHLKNKDDYRVRDYIIYLRAHYPNLYECGVDINLIKLSCKFLRDCGWKLDLGSDHSDRPSKYIRGRY